MRLQLINFYLFLPLLLFTALFPGSCIAQGGKLTLGSATGDHACYFNLLPDSVLNPPDPEFIVNPQTRQDWRVDVDGDGTDDFELNFIENEIQNHRTCQIDFIGLNGNRVAATPSQLTVALFHLSHFNLGDTLSPNVAWNNTGTLVYDDKDIGNNTRHKDAPWEGVAPGYAAIKMTKNGAEYYGWVRMSVDGGSNPLNWRLTIQDYAIYCDENLLALNPAADTGIQLSVFPNPASHQLNLSFQDLPVHSTLKVELIDPLGHTLRSETHLQRGEELAFQWDLSPYQPGVYFLRVSTIDRVQSIPLFIHR